MKTIKVRVSDNKDFARKYSGIKKIRFWFKIWRGMRQADAKLKQTLQKKICYYGPFKGEFGHMTAHTAPFLMYLHKQRVKVIYCGMEIHKPLLVDENKNSIIYKFIPLRDFFAEVSPRGNSTVPPEDVIKEIKKFEQEAQTSDLPFWNIGDDFYYWFIHRNWLLKGHTFVYDLQKAYRTKTENSVCVFPRNKGGKISKNNGERWDYNEVINAVKPFFEKVYVCGHPSQCEAIQPSENVELCVSSDNSVMLEKCANSRLIITQHSGINNIGEYTNTKVLIIYKGGQKMDDIGSIYNTLRFRPSIGKHHTLSFAFSIEQIVSFCKSFTKEK